MEPKQHLIQLAESLAAHRGVTHWAISMQVLGKGDFFNGLLKGGDCRTSTYQRVVQKLADAWPDDLEWPREITRPPRTKRHAA